MTPEKIIKALNHCKSTTPIDCHQCPYKNQTTPIYKNCINLLVEDTIALLHEKDAEIETYRQALGEARVALIDATLKGNQARAEAIAEFSRRAKASLNIFTENYYYIFCVINSIEKEMKEAAP